VQRSSYPETGEDVAVGRGQGLQRPFELSASIRPPLHLRGEVVARQEHESGLCNPRRGDEMW
jgi:hypothetical protein